MTLHPTIFSAATVVLTREAHPGFEIFLIKRHHRMGFMASAHVFPGGKVDDADRDWGEALRPKIRAMASARVDLVDSAGEAAAFCLAAIREMAEESGVILAEGDKGEYPGLHVAQQIFSALKKGISFRVLLDEHALEPALGALSPLAWWLTPKEEKKRYDTCFFIAKMPGHQRATSDQKESTTGDWWRPSKALEAFEKGEIYLAPPTFAILEDFQLAGDLDRARSISRPLGRICPHLVPTEKGGLRFCLPGHPEHPETRAPAPKGRRIELIMDPSVVFHSVFAE